jgi:hypothetical protein
MGVAIDYASREGELIRHIMRGVVEQVLSEDEAEKERIAEHARFQTLQKMRAKRNMRVIYLLGTVLLLGAGVYAVKEFLLPRVGSNTIGYVKESTRNMLGEMLGFETIEREIPLEREGQKQVWLTSEEEHFILSQRQKKEQLLQLTEELTQARLQLEGWETERDDNLLRETSLEYWRKRVDDLERKIRNLWVLLKEGQLQPAPIPQEEASDSDSK